MAIVHVGNARTANSVFDHQASTASFVALASHPCNEVVLTVASGAIQARRDTNPGFVYVLAGMAYPIAVRANSSEVFIQQVTGTVDVGYECRSFGSGPPLI